MRNKKWMLLENREKLQERNVWSLRRKKLKCDLSGSHSGIAEDAGLLDVTHCLVNTFHFTFPCNEVHPTNTCTGLTTSLSIGSLH
jgi:hypothetical protein